VVGAPHYRRVVLPIRFTLPAALAAATLSFGALGPLASPAAADVTGSTSTADVVLFNHCQQHLISYDVLVSPGTLLWRLEIQVADLHGQVSEGTVVNSATSPATSGTVQVTFCGSEPAGTYTVRGTGFYQIIPAVQIPFALPETSFEVRPAASRTALAEKSLGHGRYRLTTRVRKESGKGFRPANGIPVRLERLVSGRWKPVDGVTLTSVHGRAVAVVDGHPGQHLRAVVPALNNIAGSTSRTVKL
jgi:hypothetical protein